MCCLTYDESCDICGETAHDSWPADQQVTNHLAALRRHHVTGSTVTSRLWRSRFMLIPAFKQWRIGVRVVNAKAQAVAAVADGRNDWRS